MNGGREEQLVTKHARAQVRLIPSAYGSSLALRGQHGMDRSGGHAGGHAGSGLDSCCKTPVQRGAHL